MVKRRVYSISWWGIMGIVVAVVGLVVAMFVLFRRPTSDRTTVVLVGDPVVVWSKDRRTKRVVRLTIPKETAIEGVHGYGRYSLESLWRLGSIEKKDGSVLSQSLQESLGIPIPWYIGPKAEEDVRLSIGSLLTYLTAGYRTNMPPAAAISFITDTIQTRSDQIEELSLEGAMVSTMRPDGTSERTLDTSRVDIILGNVLEDERIRGEGLSVAVYNTTDMPILGSRVARLLGHIGVFVVRVGNDTPAIDVCTIRGTKRLLSTTTAAAIQELLGCRMREEGADVADLEVRVGTQYQARFLPQ